MGRVVKIPLRREKIRLYNKRFGVFDIETAGLGGPFLDAVAEQELGQPERFGSARGLFDYLLNETPCDSHGKRVPYRWYAHNLGGYDALYLIDLMLEYVRDTGVPIETISRGGSIIGYKVKVDRGDGHKTCIELVDSLPLLSAPLAMASKVYAPQYEKHGHCPDHDFTEGGIYDPGCAVCYSYLIGDCDALLATMRAVEQQEHDVFGINLKITGGSAGVEMLKRTIPVNQSHWRLPPDKEEFAYEAVYGGFVWPGQDTLPHDDVVKRDCTAAYAARAREGVPCGTPAWTGEFMEGLPGIYHVTARSPEDIAIPLVPNRYRKAADGNIPLWPTGEWETVITSNTMLFAEQQGYKFIVHRGIVWPRIDYPYNPMMDMLEKMECPADGSQVDPAIKLGAKIKRNSVIGKAATKRVQERVIIGDAPIGFAPALGPKGEALPYYIKAEKPEGRMAAHIQPHWNAWITAAQRITVQRILIEAGDGARYADTDCVAVDRAVMDRLVEDGVIPTSDRKQYGTWPVEDEWDWFQVGGPKNYTGQQKGGARKSKAKGIRQPKRKDGPEWEAYLQAHKDTIDGVSRPEMEFESTRGARDMMKSPGGLPAVTRTRRFSTLDGSSTWQRNVDGRVRPYHLDLLCV